MTKRQVLIWLRATGLAIGTIAVDSASAQDLKTLSGTSPLAESYQALYSQDAERRTLYELQLKAILSLATQGPVKDPDLYVNALAPYLDYVTSEEGQTRQRVKPATDKIFRLFPVVPLLVLGPGLDEALLRYVADEKNPKNLRLAVLSVSKIRDVQLFKKALAEVEKENWSDKPEVKEYLNQLASDGSWFWGIPEVTHD